MLRSVPFSASRESSSILGHHPVPANLRRAVDAVILQTVCLDLLSAFAVQLRILLRGHQVGFPKFLFPTLKLRRHFAAQFILKKTAAATHCSYTLAPLPLLP